MADNMTSSVFTTDAQLYDLLKQADNLAQQDQLPNSLEAYKATIDMQGMIALYAKQNVYKLRSERGEDPLRGPSADTGARQYWKDLADSKEWAIKEPLSQFLSSTSWGSHSENHWSEIESWGNVHLDPKSFFASVKDEWIKIEGVEGAIEELVNDFFRKLEGVNLQDLSQASLPQAQQCISISNIDEKAADVSYQPTVSILFVELELTSTETMTDDPGDEDGGNHREKIRAEIRVSQSNLEAQLDLYAIQESRDYLDTTRKRMMELGLDEFQRILTSA